MPCNCKNCAAGLPDIYCVATRTLSEAERTRLNEITGRRVIDSTTREPFPRAGGDEMSLIERARLFLRDTEQDPGYETVAFDPGDEIAIEPSTWEEFVPISELEGAVEALEAYGKHANNCSVLNRDDPDRCTCGWTATLNHFRGQAGPSPTRTRRFRPSTSRSAARGRTRAVPSPSKRQGEVVTLVMDGGTAYVMVTILGMTIANAEAASLPGAPREVLIHAHNELAGQLGMDLYE